MRGLDHISTFVVYTQFAFLRMLTIEQDENMTVDCKFCINRNVSVQFEPCCKCSDVGNGTFSFYRSIRG